MSCDPLSHQTCAGVKEVMRILEAILASGLKEGRTELEMGSDKREMERATSSPFAALLKTRASMTLNNETAPSQVDLNLGGVLET